MNNLPVDVLRNIDRCNFIHPIAHLVNNLQFEILPPDEFTYCPAQLAITCPNGNFLILHRCAQEFFKSRIYYLILEHFGDA